jgi:hypothetical protein
MDLPMHPESKRAAPIQPTWQNRDREKSDVALARAIRKLPKEDDQPRDTAAISNAGLYSPWKLSLEAAGLAAWADVETANAFFRT